MSAIDSMCLLCWSWDFSWFQQGCVFLLKCSDLLTTFMSLIYFVFILRVSDSSFQLFHLYFLTELSLSHLITLAPLSEVNGPYAYGPLSEHTLFCWSMCLSLSQEDTIFIIVDPLTCSDYFGSFRFHLHTHFKGSWMSALKPNWGAGEWGCIESTDQWEECGPHSAESNPMYILIHFICSVFHGFMSIHGISSIFSLLYTKTSLFNSWSGIFSVTESVNDKFIPSLLEWNENLKLQKEMAQLVKCLTSVRTGVQIPRTHVKSQV